MSLYLLHELNNLGVDALERNEYKHATEFFRHSLQQANAVIRNSVTNSTATVASRATNEQEEEHENNSEALGEQVRRPSKRVKTTKLDNDSSFSTIESSSSSSSNACSSDHHSMTRSSLMNHLQRRLHNDDDDDDDESCSTTSMLFTNGIRMLDITKVTSTISTSTSSTTSCNSHKRKTSLPIDGMKPCFSNDPMEEAKVACGIIIFNMGLALQLYICTSGGGGRTSKSSSSSSSHHRQVQILYARSYQLLTTSIVTTMDNGSSSSAARRTGQQHEQRNILKDLVSMAVLNNWLQSSFQQQQLQQVGEHFSYNMEKSNEETRMIRVVLSWLVQLAHTVQSTPSYTTTSSTTRTTDTTTQELLYQVANSFLKNASTTTLRLFRPTSASAAPAA